MLRNLAVAGVVGGLIAAAVIWTVGLPQDRTAPTPQDTAPAPMPVKQAFAAAAANPGQDIGPGLYAMEGADQRKDNFGHSSLAFIQMPDAHFAAIRTEEVPTEREGKIWFIATDNVDPKQPIEAKDRKYFFQEEVPYLVREVRQGDKVPESEIIPLQLPESKDVKPYVRVKEGDTLEPNRVQLKKEKKWFRELHEGDEVKKGQLLALIDTSLFYDEVLSRVLKLNSKEAERIAAEKTRDEAQERLKTLERLSRTGTPVPAEERRGAELTYLRYLYDEIKTRNDVKVAGQELSQAVTQLRKHEIRSDVDGRLKMIYKKPGEAVKNLEQVFQVINAKELRLEGHVGVQFAGSLPRGKELIVEPSIQEPFQQVITAHNYEISSVAVSKDRENPLIVSASEDGTARVWERAKDAEGKLSWWDRAPAHERARFNHPVAVRSIACSPPGSATDLCLTGDADGTARLWDLTQGSDQQPRVLGKRHRGPINTVAFSPDGRYCATGGYDRNICLWDTNDGRCLYVFPTEHRGEVTSIQFTPKGKLVSAGKDNRLLVWRLGTQGAQVDTANKFENRSGDVPVLGVSPSGDHVFFDRARELRILSLDGGRIDGVLGNPTGAANFSTMALFSPDGKLALAANGSEGQLQLWRLPTPQSRGYELRQFVWNRAPTTAGTFYPHTVPGHGFAVTGTKDGQLVVWALPSDQEINEQVKAEVIMTGESIESSQRQVPIWAKITSNPGRTLYTGNTATMVLYQK